MLIVWAATVFHLAPNHHTPWRFDVPGAVFTAVGWLLLSVGYGTYIQLAGTGNSAVGVVGGLLLGLTWMWLAVVVLLIGGEINALLAHRAGVARRRGPVERWAAAAWQRSGAPDQLRRLRRRTIRRRRGDELEPDEGGELGDGDGPVSDDGDRDVAETRQ